MKILGCRLDAIDADEATRRILAFAQGASSAHVVTLGTEMVVHAQADSNFRRIVNGSALSLCDTAGLLAVARARGAALKERVTGVELIEHVCAGAASTGIPIFLLGGAPGVASAAAAVLQGRYPLLLVAGSRDGYFNDANSDSVARDIRASGARIVFAGLGFPHQEEWLAAYLPQTGCGAGIGVGGSLDVVSGNVRRAPALLRRGHLEWLYRLIKEPRRWRRQLALPRFVLLVARDGIRSRFTNNGDATS
ncbi:MAG: WecB/TagA/CpsF family glycosyltransferase [Candidatus Eremiobacteraeota bacterium]|nr:WecB/TagA/CpsF family glycosyltransferase [Candidatus Eremiobacteraeota bacterium]